MDTIQSVFQYQRENVVPYIFSGTTNETFFYLMAQLSFDAFLIAIILQGFNVPKKVKIPLFIIPFVMIFSMGYMDPNVASYEIYSSYMSNMNNVVYLFLSTLTIYPLLISMVTVPFLLLLSVSLPFFPDEKKVKLMNEPSGNMDKRIVSTFGNMLLSMMALNAISFSMIGYGFDTKTAFAAGSAAFVTMTCAIILYAYRKHQDRTSASTTS